MYTTPYARIWRPGTADDYCIAREYSRHFFELCDGYARLENHLRKFLSHTPNIDAHWDIPSKKIYPLLKAITFELEENIRTIFKDNHYSPIHNDIIYQFQLLDHAMRLSEYTTTIVIGSTTYTIKPFLSLKDDELPWYLSGAKVFRSNKVHKASATPHHFVTAVAGLRCILYAQFATQVDTQIAPKNIKKLGSGFFTATSLFNVVPPTWPLEEYYDFEFNPLKKQKLLVNTFNFIEFQ